MEAGEIMSMLSSQDGEVVFLATELLLGRDDIEMDKKALLDILHPNGKAAITLYRAFKDLNLARIQCMIVLDKYDIQWKRTSNPMEEELRSSSKKTKRKTF